MCPIDHWVKFNGVGVSAGILGPTQVCTLTGGLGRCSWDVPLRAGAGYNAPNRLQAFVCFRWPMCICGPSIRSGSPLPRSFKPLSHENRAYGSFSSLLIAYRGPSHPGYRKRDCRFLEVLLRHLLLFYKTILKRSFTMQLVWQRNAKVRHKRIVEKDRAG